jgi:hypothetical protein
MGNGRIWTRLRHSRTPKTYLAASSGINQFPRAWPMSRSAPKTQSALLLLAGAFGLFLLAYLVHRAGPAKLLASIATLRWGLGLVLLWGGVAHIVKAWAWRLTLLEDKRHVSFARLLGLRLSSEAVGQLGGLAQMFGEGLRVSLLGSTMPLSTGIASVTIDRVFFVLSAAVVSVIGLLSVLIALPLPHTLAPYASVSALILLLIILLSAVAIAKRWPVLSWVAQTLARIPYCKAWIERERALIHSVENALLDFYHRTPGAFWASFLLNLGCHAAAVFEVYLILWLMGAKLTLFGAFAIEALTKVVNIAGAFNPGNIGTYEGGNMLFAKIFGLTGAAGLTLAFIRRLRALFWAAVGIFCLIIFSNRTKQSSPIASRENTMHIGPEPISSEGTSDGDPTAASLPPGRCPGQQSWCARFLFSAASSRRGANFAARHLECGKSWRCANCRGYRSCKGSADTARPAEDRTRSP